VHFGLLSGLYTTILSRTRPILGYTVPPAGRLRTPPCRAPDFGPPRQGVFASASAASHGPPAISPLPLDAGQGDALDEGALGQEERHQNRQGDHTAHGHQIGIGQRRDADGDDRASQIFQP